MQYCNPPPLPKPCGNNLDLRDLSILDKLFTS